MGEGLGMGVRSATSDVKRGRRNGVSSRQPPTSRLHPSPVEGEGFVAQAATHMPDRRPRITASASLTMRSTSSFTVGTSWIRPCTVPAVQTP